MSSPAKKVKSLVDDKIKQIKEQVAFAKESQQRISEAKKESEKIETFRENVEKTIEAKKRSRTTPSLPVEQTVTFVDQQGTPVIQGNQAFASKVEQALQEREKTAQAQRDRAIAEELQRQGVSSNQNTPFRQEIKQEIKNIEQERINNLITGSNIDKAKNIRFVKQEEQPNINKLFQTAESEQKAKETFRKITFPLGEVKVNDKKFRDTGAGRFLVSAVEKPVESVAFGFAKTVFAANPVLTIDQAKQVSQKQLRPSQTAFVQNLKDPDSQLALAATALSGVVVASVPAQGLVATKTQLATQKTLTTAGFIGTGVSGVRFVANPSPETAGELTRDVLLDVGALKLFKQTSFESSTIKFDDAKFSGLEIQQLNLPPSTIIKAEPITGFRSLGVSFDVGTTRIDQLSINPIKGAQQDFSSADFKNFEDIAFFKTNRVTQATIEKNSLFARETPDAFKRFVDVEEGRIFDTVVKENLPAERNRLVMDFSKQDFLTPDQVKLFIEGINIQRTNFANPSAPSSFSKIEKSLFTIEPIKGIDVDFVSSTSKTKSATANERLYPRGIGFQGFSKAPFLGNQKLLGMQDPFDIVGITIQKGDLVRQISLDQKTGFVRGDTQSFNPLFFDVKEIRVGKEFKRTSKIKTIKDIVKKLETKGFQEVKSGDSVLLQKLEPPEVKSTKDLSFNVSERGLFDQVVSKLKSFYSPQQQQAVSVVQLTPQVLTIQQAMLLVGKLYNVQSSRFQQKPFSQDKAFASFSEQQTVSSNVFPQKTVFKQTTRVLDDSALKLTLPKTVAVSQDLALSSQAISTGRLDSRVKVDTLMKTDTAVKFDTLMKTDTAVKIDVLTRTDTRVKIDTLMKTNTLKRTKTPRETFKMNTFGFPENNFGSKKDDDSFFTVVVGKKGNKIYEVKKGVSFERAVSFARTKLINTAAASVKVLRSSGEVVNPASIKRSFGSDFIISKSGDRIVQRREKRISSFGEKADIRPKNKRTSTKNNFIKLTNLLSKGVPLRQAKRFI